MCDWKILDWEDKSGSEFLTAVPRLERDLSGMIKTTNAKQLSKRLMIVRDRVTACYLLGDDILSGFGTGLFAKGNLMFESRYWSRHEQENTSNLCEA